MYILTVAHLFLDKGEDYFFEIDEEKGFGFSFKQRQISVERIEKTSIDAIRIEIGTINSETGKMMLKTDSVAQPAFRLLSGVVAK